jgi:hypothetical protein
MRSFIAQGAHLSAARLTSKSNSATHTDWIERDPLIATKPYGPP